ncbi:MAG TPA: metallophosphoesterase, partial [Anseongella sp.]|nr:metallophosphoesterase [Anseongella sp.]
ELTMIVINTQWWLQSGFRPIGKQYGCNVKTEAEFFTRLEKLLVKNRHKRVLVIGHAPIYSYSIHGGRYKWTHHVFPLTIYHKRAYLPLPVVGSLLPLYRKYYGAREDLSHPRYRRLRGKLKELFRKHPGIIYVSGHEHNLQHISKYGNDFIISGSASKIKYVTSGKYARFTMARKGFFKLCFGPGRGVRCQAWVADKKNPEGLMVYKQTLDR